MSDFDSDLAFDAELRSVPVPPGFAGRLRGIAVWSDAELDRALRDVAVPDALLEQLVAASDEASVDEQLCEVSVSPRAMARVRNIPRTRPRASWRRFALAMSLMIILGLGHLSALSGVLISMRPQRPSARETLFIDRGPLEIASPPANEVVIVPGPPLSPFEEFAAVANADSEISPMMHLIQKPVTGPASELIREMHNEWQPWDNWMRMRWSVLGYADTQAPLVPDMESFHVPLARGVEADLGRRFDREFLYRLGTHPPVAIASGKRPAEINVPLTKSTDSFEAAWQAIREGRPPQPDQIRVEDFISAVSCPLTPAMPGRIAIRTAAGPAVFDRTSSGLLLVGAVAGGSPVREPATHLVLAVDISASMNWDGKFRATRAALLSVLRDLSARDRISLVVFNEAASVAADEASRDDAPAIIELMDRLSPAGGSDVPRGLEMAISVALETENAPDMARRVVLVTDNEQPLNDAVAARLHSMLDQAAAVDFRLDFVGFGATGKTNASLASLAGYAGGNAYSADSAEQLHWQLTEALIGTSALAATEVRLKIRFNPDAVAAYRLVGHESTGVGGLLPGSALTDLHVGEQSCSLFEVWLYPNDEDDVAYASLSWADPHTGRVANLPDQRISRLQFASSFESSPLPLQAAAIAAEAGQILRQGFSFELASANQYRYSPKASDLKDVLNAAGQVNVGLQRQIEYQRFLRFIGEASQVSLARRPGLAKSGSRGMVGGRWREARD